MASSPNLHFGRNHRFKIVQFTDIHWKDESPHEQRLIRMIETILDLENPDLVVLTGDSTHSPTRTLEGFRRVTAPMAEREIPWAAVLGNHDDEGDAGRSEIASALESLPLSLMQKGPAELGGCGNYVLDLCQTGSDQAAARLYFIDSNSYSPLKSRGVDGYAWITREQIQWFAGEFRPLPSLAFFHIPLPEYHAAWEKGATVGQKGEAVCSPGLNSGFFAMLVESGTVLGTFVGHDHANDYAAMHKGVCLTYGRALGLDTYGELTRGARVIELTEGLGDFASWIREETGGVADRFTHSQLLIRENASLHG